MSQAYRLFGVELSPYSLKVWAYFRYKQIPHEWIARDSTNQEEFARYAKLPLVPLVVTPDGQGRQDSTPIMEHFEELQPEPSIQPRDPTLAFLSALIEEYGDEWGNKQMFHYRWTYAPDQQATAERIARLTRPGLSEEEYAAATEQIRTRMVPRLSFVGSSEQTREHIESSFDRLLARLEPHLSATHVSVRWPAHVRRFWSGCSAPPMLHRSLGRDDHAGGCPERLILGGADAGPQG